jgi:hypothetical protein
MGTIDYGMKVTIWGKYPRIDNEKSNELASLVLLSSQIEVV